MWDDLRGKWAVERQQLQRLLEYYRPLLEKQRVATVSAFLTVGFSHARYPNGNRT